MTALVVRLCCLLLLSAAALADQKNNYRMSQRVGFSAIFTQPKLVQGVNVSTVKPIRVKLSQLTPKSPVFVWRGKPLL